MATRRNKNSKRKIGGKKNKTKKRSGKRFESAITVAQRTLNKTGSLNKARISLRKQALSNARRLFGAVNI